MGALDAADDEVDRLQPFERLHVDAAADHTQVAAFHELQAEIARKVGVAEVVLVVGPRCEQRDQRIIPLQALHEFGLQPFEVAGEPDRVAGAENVAHKLAVQEPVGEREAGARGRLGVHVDDAPRPARVAHQIGGEEIDEMGCGLGFPASVQEGRIAENKPRRNLACLEQRLRTVNVLGDQVDQRGPLNEAAFEMRPFLRPYDDGDEIDGPRLAGSGLGEKVVSDAVFQNQPAQALMPLRLLIRRERAKGLRERRP